MSKQKGQKKKRKMLTECHELMKQWDYNKNKNVSPKNLSAGSGFKVWWVCEKGHSWQATVNHRHHGTGCPVCSNLIIVKGENDLKTVMPDLAEQWNYEKNGTLTPEQVSSGTHRKAWWRCLKGHEWQASIVSRASGYGCPCCSGLSVVSGETDLATVRPDLAAQFDISKNKGVLPTDICNSSNKKYWWLCEKGHGWKTAPNSRQKRGCPICSGKIVLAGFNDLLSLNPELAKQWDYNKNELQPSEVTISSGRNAWWLCKKGHSWSAIIADRKNGSGCPYCSGHRAITGETDLVTLIPKIALEWDYDKNGDSDPKTLTSQSNKEVWWKCKEGHSWETRISNRYNGNGCPFCSGNEVVKGINDLQSQYPEIAMQWDLEKNQLNPDEIHSHSNKYAWWVCKSGHSWKALINNRSGKNRGCPYCSGYYAIPTETDLLTLCPQIASEWDYNKNAEDIRTITEYSHKRMWWKCKKGHSWQINVNARRKGNGCPYCAGRKVIVGENDLLTLAPHLKDEWDYDRNTIEMTEVSLKSNIKVWWKCKNGHSWKTQINNRIIGCGCPYCIGKVNYESKTVKG